MTGDVVKAMRACPQPIVAAIDGVCAGAGAILAMASRPAPRHDAQQDRVPVHPRRPRRLRHGRLRILPRIIGQGRASELLYTGRAMGGEEASAWGFFNRLCAPEALLRRSAWRSPPSSPTGRRSPTAMTKRMLHQEWAMGVDEAIDAEAQAQASACMTQDFQPRLSRLRGEAEAALRGQLNRRQGTVRAFCDWPFFEPERASRLAASRIGTASLGAIATPGRANVAIPRRATSTPPAARWSRKLGAAGWLRHAIGGTAYGGVADASTRARSASSARRWRAIRGLADFAFAMQGLGSGAITLFGTRGAEARVICRASRAARRSRRSRSPSRTPARTWRR